MSQRAKRPLNSKAVAAADKELYRRHENDPRPNALFDENGNRKPLDPNDPSQASLRLEWIKYYLAHGGEMENSERSDRDVNHPVQMCPVEKPAHLTVVVRWTPWDAPVKGATVKIEGPVSSQAITDDQGIAEFPDIPSGGYVIEASLNSGYPLADAARRHIGSMDWEYASSRPPYPAGANKCNLFVYETAKGAGYSVPKRTRRSLRQWLKEVWYPPLAGEWATPDTDIGNWKMVDDPQPGDVIAERIEDYDDATGHMGIISYPDPSGGSVRLSAGAHETSRIFLGRKTVSAAEYSVKENDWGWRNGQNPKFRRYKP
jgi:hypothetical protein